MGSISVFLKPLSNEFGWTRANTAFGYTIASLGSAYFGIIWGYIADKYGTRFFGFFATFFMVSCLFLLSKQSSILHFYVLYFCFGAFGNSVVGSPLYANVGFWFKENPGLAIGITVTIVSSILPARKASQVSPMEAIRDSISTPKGKSLFIRLLLGSLISTIGFGMLFGVLFEFLDLPTLSALQQVGFGAGVIFIGISVITPSITKPFVFLFDKAYNILFGILGKLETEN